MLIVIIDAGLCEEYDIDLAIEISQGRREIIVPDTPEEYVNIYTECWDNEPDNRPDMIQVVDRLDSIITKPNIKENKQMNIDDEAKLQSLALQRSSVIASS
ncbi:13174_t:CDS:2, partial [Funneliformis geosporum]